MWGSSNSNQNRRNPMRLSAEEEETSEEGSVSSTNAMVKCSDIVADGYGSGSEVGPVFAAWTDSNQHGRNPMRLSVEKEQKSEEGSVSSTNAVVKSLGIVAGGRWEMWKMRKMWKRKRGKRWAIRGDGGRGRCCYMEEDVGEVMQLLSRGALGCQRLHRMVKREQE